MKLVHLGLAAALAAGLSGCESVALTAFGIGASTGVSHTLSGITYRTFTAPVKDVRSATMTALNRMGMKVAGTEKTGSMEIIKANGIDRDIEIELEPITANTTRMRSVARKSGGFIQDSATATEIIIQTEKVMGNV